MTYPKKRVIVKGPPTPPYSPYPRKFDQTTIEIMRNPEAFLDKAVEEARKTPDWRTALLGLWSNITGMVEKAREARSLLESDD